MKARAGIAPSAIIASAARPRWTRIYPSPLCLEVAFGFGAIDAESIEVGDLVQETVLWRYGNHIAPVGEQDWLAKLPVPVAQGEGLALVSGNLEFWSLEVGDDLGRIARLCAARCFTHHAHCGPRLHIE